MTTLLTPYRITPLQRNLCIAVTTQIVDGGPFDLETGLEGVAARNGDAGGDLVGFSRHVEDGEGFRC